MAVMDCWWLWRCAAADCGGGDRRGDAESSGVVRQELCIRRSLSAGVAIEGQGIRD
nr:hypothetical protein Iba_chr08aCG8000 [Ipomoea batatas]